MVILDLKTFWGRDLYTFYIITLDFVCLCRKGSIAADFVIETTKIDTDEIASANKNLPEAMSSIAPVVGTITALYNSKLKKAGNLLLVVV